MENSLTKGLILFSGYNSLANLLAIETFSPEKVYNLYLPDNFNINSRRLIKELCKQKNILYEERPLRLNISELRRDIETYLMLSFFFSDQLSNVKIVLDRTLPIDYSMVVTQYLANPPDCSLVTFEDFLFYHSRKESSPYNIFPLENNDESSDNLNKITNHLRNSIKLSPLSYAIDVSEIIPVGNSLNQLSFNVLNSEGKVEFNIKTWIAYTYKFYYKVEGTNEESSKNIINEINKNLNLNMIINLGLST